MWWHQRFALADDRSSPVDSAAGGKASDSQRPDAGERPFDAPFRACWPNHTKKYQR
jgi:hypothetical protein